MNQRKISKMVFVICIMFFVIISLHTLLLKEYQTKGEQFSSEKKIESENLFVISRYVNGDIKFGYINQSGKMIVEPQFYRAWEFSEGLAVIQDSSDTWGFIDKYGTKTTLPKSWQVSYPELFSESLLLVRIDEQYGYINKSAKISIKPQFESANNFSDGLASIKINGKSGYLDHSGKVVILCQFEKCYDFSEGLAAVKLGNKWGYIDKSGKTVIQQQFDKAEPFSEGLVAVKVLQSNIMKAGYIDKEGKIVIPLNYQDDHAAFSFHEGLAPSYDEVFCKYIDKAGKIIIRLQCNIFEEFGEGFSEGLALVKMDNKYIYIDKIGKASIPLKFDTASLFKHGLAYVSVRNNLLKTSGYIDKTGEFIWSKTYLGD
jgi:WG containing repeat